tara:strand:- start:5794 stop:7353 length:1560 start_codon:yes stop_codon:yes gene_type:complete
MHAYAQLTIPKRAHLSVDITRDGRLVFNKNDDIWVIQNDGTNAQQLTKDLKSAKRPRWSFSSEYIVYTAATKDRRSIWLTEVNSGRTENLSLDSNVDIYPFWHPDNQRVFYSTNVDGNGYNLWEVNTQTRSRKQVTKTSGDEIEGAWSSDGKDLVFIHRENDWFSLVLRSKNQPDEILLRTKDKIAGPAWRPDGTLITFFKSNSSDISIEMVILSEPRLIRRYASNEEYVTSPIAWLDRHNMIYSANGLIKKRLFNSWSSNPLRFQNTFKPNLVTFNAYRRPILEWPNEPKGQFVIRAKRLFDGVNPGYQYNKDILISGGRIKSIEDNKDWQELIVIEMANQTIIPGFIDVDARLPKELSAKDGPKLLRMGITTIVGNHPGQKKLNVLWSGKKMPGPRFLNSEKWQNIQLTRSEFDASAVVTTSKETSFQSGEAISTQIRASQVLGLTPEQTLRGIGVNAAAAIQVDPYLGRIANGVAADLLFIEGDPLVNADDAMNILAIIRNGRFYSISGLIERTNP